MISNDQAYDNLQTWPKAFNQRTLGELNEWIQTEKIINKAKKYISKSNIDSTSHENDTKADKEAKELISALTNALVKAKEGAKEQINESEIFNERAHRKRHQNAQSISNMGVIREDPHFESMIICDTRKSCDSLNSQCMKNSATDSHRTSMYGIYNNNNYEHDRFKQKPINDDEGEMVDADNFPMFIRAFPHIFMLTSATLYVGLGALMFQYVDTTIGEHPYHSALMYAFQTCATIGWGVPVVTTKWGQFASIFYTFFGVPLLFSAFANVGRLISEFYCIDWILLTSVVRRRVKVVTQKIFPRLPNVEDVGFLD